MKQYRPLSGLRVLSFEGWVSLPSATRLLADLGADVVRVAQPRGGGEGINAAERFAEQGDLIINKRVLPLDLRNARGNEIAIRLAMQADVVCNNFRAGVLDRFGLGDKQLLAAKPSLIVMQITGYGAAGPWISLPALGPSVEAAGGMNALIGDGSLPPMRVGGSAYADVASGRYALLGLLSALRDRDRTGKGAFIDLSMYESIVNLIGDKVLGSADSGLRHPRHGNRDNPDAVPQGIYRCAGKDEWVAISVMDDEQWGRLAAVLGDPLLLAPAFGTVEGRTAAYDKIDAAIERWTSSRGKTAVATELQSLGVAAGPLGRPTDIPSDPNHLSRHFFKQVPHSSEILGQTSHPHMAIGWAVQGFARPDLRTVDPDPPPDWQVLVDWLDMSPDEVRALAEEHIAYDTRVASDLRPSERADAAIIEAPEAAPRVIDLATGPAGQFATMLLADLGCDVLRVERAVEATRPAPNHLLHDYLNRRKRSVVIDLETDAGRAALYELVDDAACVVEDGGPGGLEKLGVSFERMEEVNPGVVLLSLSPFGLAGERKDWLANDFIVQSMGGLVWGTGWDGERPIKLPENQAYFIGGLNGALAAFVGMRGVESHVHSGVHIDLAMQETFAQQWSREVMRFIYAGRPYRRETRGAGRQGFPHTALAKDGWLYLLATGMTWETVAIFLGLEEFLTEEWSDPQVREKRWSELDPAFVAAVASRPKYEWVVAAADHRLQFAPIDDPLDVLGSPQLAARGFFEEATLRSGARVPSPGLPFPVHVARQPNRVPARGEHTDELIGNAATQ